jgi:hypothetical protein
VSEGWRIAPLDITRASTHGALQSGYLLPHLLLHLQTVATTLIIALTILLVTSLWQVCELHGDLFLCSMAAFFGESEGNRCDMTQKNEFKVGLTV